MIEFKSLKIEDKELWERYMPSGGERGCEYSFANMYLWGKQKYAVVCGHFVLFSQFEKQSVYPYPVGSGDKKAVLDSIICDAKERGIPCRITGLNEKEIELLETFYPQKFRFHCDRNAYDYVYSIDDLADLRGKKLHGKRNHVNRFWDEHRDCRVERLGEQNLSQVRQMVDQWYEDKLQADPEGDYYMERTALNKAFRYYDELGMEGLVLSENEKILAVTLGSQMSADTFDVHFEKARPGVDGAYAVINNEFAKYIREKYPQVGFFNREEDMGIEGLRKAKMSYRPHHLVEKCWAYLMEDENED